MSAVQGRRAIIVAQADSGDFSSETAFDIVAPAEQRVPFVLASPHSGRLYPQRFLDMSQLDAWQIRRSEDCLVDELFLPAVALGAPMIRAHFPRAYLDANREPLELDPSMFNAPLPLAVNAASPRVAAGLGIVPRVVGEGRSIYRGRIAPREALLRLETCYFPFHRALKAMVDETVTRFGHCVLVDCHSMPGQITHPEDGTQPDIIIGDRFGQTASSAFVGAVINALRGKGLHVSHNRPYAGGFITEHYGVPGYNVHAIQIEVSRRLYLDEARYQPSDGFARTQRLLGAVLADLMALPDAVFRPPRLAAE
jgi:N-formylglutamate amidohydrolase